MKRVDILQKELNYEMREEMKICVQIFSSAVTISV